MNQKQMDDIFVKTHMGFTIKGGGVLGDSFGKDVLDSAAPYWTVWWTHNTARVNLLSLMGNI